MNDQLLEDVSVSVEPADSDSDGWCIVKELPIKSLTYNQSEVGYILLSMPDDGRLTGAFNATLKFKVRDVDPSTGEPDSSEFYDDVYSV